MKTGPGALGTVENESGSAKCENETRRPRYRPKRVRECKLSKRDLTPSVPSKTSRGAQNLKTVPDALDTTQKESGSAKHEIKHRLARYRQK
jgi:hypothetical protein